MNPLYCETCLSGKFYNVIQYISVILVLILCMYSTGHVGVPIPNAMVKLVDVEEMRYFTANSEGEVSTSYCTLLLLLLHYGWFHPLWSSVYSVGINFHGVQNFCGVRVLFANILLLLICCVKQSILQSNVVLNHQVVYYAVTNEAIQSIVHTTVTFITSVCVAMCPLVTSSYSCDVMLFVFAID